MNTLIPQACSPWTLGKHTDAYQANPSCLYYNHYIPGMYTIIMSTNRKKSSLKVMYVIFASPKCLTNKDRNLIVNVALVLQKF